jgi:thiol-disulfide isomerase/thioredoxin
MKNNTLIIGNIVVVALILGGVVFWGTSSQTVPDGKYDQLATCIKDSGTVFFGAFWCPHCQKQKAMFGSSVSKLPYVECSMPDGNTQTQVCIDKEIKNYPTWEFPDGTRLTGEQELATLAEKTNCPLPE